MIFINEIMSNCIKLGTGEIDILKTGDKSISFECKCYQPFRQCLMYLPEKTNGSNKTSKHFSCYEDLWRFSCIPNMMITAEYMDIL